MRVRFFWRVLPTPTECLIALRSFGSPPQIKKAILHLKSTGHSSEEVKLCGLTSSVMNTLMINQVRRSLLKGVKNICGECNQ